MTNTSDKKDLTGRVESLAGLLEYQEGSVVSRTLIKKKFGTVTVFAFDAAEALSEHTVPHEALVQVLDGEVEITISGQPHTVRAGEMVIMPANQPHAVKAITAFKMLLVMVRE